MDEKARQYFNKPLSELSDYERMMLDIMAAREPAEEPCAGETPAEETPIVEAPAEEVPVEEAPVEEAPAEEAPAEETPVEEAPVEEAPVEEAPVEEAPVEEAPAEEAPAAVPDDSDVKIAGDAAEEKREPIPLLVEEKNPELEPVVVNRPTIQFMNSIEREKKITRRMKRRRIRSGFVVLGLCAALILVAVLYKGFVLKEPIMEKTEPTPEPTPEAVSEVAPTPEPTPVPTPTPEPEHRYVVERAPLSWVGAQDLCLSSGGYLAVINSREEFNKITAMADEQNIEFLWIGAHRDVTSNTIVWERGESVDGAVDPNDRRMSLWAPGEPSFIDGDGTSEDYIILWNHDGGWRYWDSRGDLNEIWGWRDRVAYVCEFDN